MVRDARPGGLTYRDSGVDDAAVSSALAQVEGALRSTYTPQVVSAPGAFAGLFRADFPGYAEPLLAATTDSVGTKARLAVEAGRPGGTGFDIVNHCANDLLVSGARPLFFLDYFGTAELKPDELAAVIRGVSEASRALGCAVIKGETAQLPGFYTQGVFDLVGTMVGVVDRPHLLGAHRVRAGDALLGLASVGLHTNGFSLARRALFEVGGRRLSEAPPELGGETLADALLRPHRAYGPSVLPLLPDEDIHAMAHITGGGIPGNLMRVLPEGVTATVQRDRWAPPLIFGVIQQAGGIMDDEMFSTFNLGVGMVVVVAEAAADRLAAALSNGETVYRMGAVAEGPRGVDIL